MYQIKQAETIPTFTGVTSTQMKYPFKLLEVGQSFVVPDSDGVPYSNIRVAMHKARYRKLTPGRDYKAERMADGYRIWRVK